VVIDADAIAVIDLKEDAGIFANRNYPCVLTPHLGEFNRLLSQKNSSGLAVLTELTETVSKLSSAVVLKGPSTVVGMPLGQTFFNFSPNAGMATGGTGDILAGILGAILAQEFAQAQELGIQLDRTDRFVLLEKSILLGLLLHTRAGHHAVQKGGVRGMIASTLLEYLPTAFKELETIAESDL
jgi:NAD(P)H-hydrate epimerase